MNMNRRHFLGANATVGADLASKAIRKIHAYAAELAKAGRL